MYEHERWHGVTGDDDGDIDEVSDDSMSGQRQLYNIWADEVLNEQDVCMHPGTCA